VHFNYADNAIHQNINQADGNIAKLENPLNPYIPYILKKI
jgi:hypothetical protein